MSTKKLRHDMDVLAATGKATMGDAQKIGRTGLGRLARLCRRKYVAVPGFMPPHGNTKSEREERTKQIEELLKLPPATKIIFLKSIDLR